MKELFPIEADNLPIEVKQGTMPIPAEGKRLYITQDTKGVDFHALLGQIVQCVNMSEILAEMEQKGEVRIMAAIYDIETGEVTFDE